MLNDAEGIIKSIIKRAEKEWSRTITVDEALGTLKLLSQDNGPYGIQATVLNDSHLLVWTFGAPWYAVGEKWITEQFFVRIGRGKSSDAFAAIDRLAAKIGATGIVMATSLAHNDEALGKILVNEGYTGMSSQYFKAYTPTN